MIEIEVQNETHQTQERLKFVAVPRIGALLVDRTVVNLGDFPKKKRDLLIHMILSHHGELEYGSPVTPVTGTRVKLVVEQTRPVLTTDDRTVAPIALPVGPTYISIDLDGLEVIALDEFATADQAFGFPGGSKTDFELPKELKDLL